MLFKVIFTDEADDTFASMGRQIEQRWSEKELLKFRSRVYNVIEVLRRSPFIFKATSNDSNLRSAAVHKNCTMFYEVRESSIIIHFFLDNRQEPLL